MALLFFYFNPRSPRGERLQPAFIVLLGNVFQPSLPARGATAKTTKNYFGIFAKQRKNNLTFNKISDFLLFHSF